MVLTPLDIHNKEFTTKMRGYNPDQVNDFLDQVIKDYETLLKENTELKSQLQSSAEKVTYFNELKDALNQSIIVAQEAADKVKNNAQKEADIMQSESENKAKSLIDEATEKSQRILSETTTKASKIAIETDDLKKQTRVFRQRLQVMLESQLEVVKSQEWTDLLAKDALEGHEVLAQEIDMSHDHELDKSDADEVDSLEDDASQTLETTTDDNEQTDEVIDEEQLETDEDVDSEVQNASFIEFPQDDEYRKKHSQE